jgi:hypothetical protein
MRNPFKKNHSQNPAPEPELEAPAPVAGEDPQEVSMANRAASAPEAMGDTRISKPFVGGGTRLIGWVGATVPTVERRC